ncbi:MULTISPECIES: molybdopterin molybdotransferase MoeA [Aurantimonas]|uniref:Molybdopterin molybdenumtransferase n=1 Tax=Aurantimonas coralicida TaxID=182270 RepID=A0A0P0YZL0_9HYPH|nr:gephyrin-like molybdotransferase Glp [Aurantimonas coralicida]BAT27024.1 molybdopterin biosynthesis protein [Aurantimonas coralicida]
MSLIPVEEAYRLLVEDARPLARTETLPLRDASGRILGADLASLRTQPAFDASAMDGYAVRAADLGDEAPFPSLRLVGESAAGHAYDGTLQPGETIRISTGAPVPAGADAILIQENAHRRDSTVTATAPVVVGQHIRPAGIDFAAGTPLLTAGTVLTPGAIALAASGGHPSIPVRGRPRVAILATGDELVLPGEPIGPSQIVASNTFGVAALVREAGGLPLNCGIAPDREAAIDAQLTQAIADGADIFVTIGGASVGDHDLVGKVFAAHGVSLDFWKVAMRPGKPLMAGRLGDMRVVGLPGNPASSMVAATLFLAPLVRRLAGRPARPLYRRGILAAPMPDNGDRTDFVRARIEPDGAGPPRIVPLSRQDSSLLSIYAAADALLVRPVRAAPAEAGDPCDYVPLTALEPLAEHN